MQRDATTEEIKEAYKSIALVYHPDSNFFSEIIDEKPDPGESELFRHLTQAYNTLIKPDARREYDSTLPPELPKWGEKKPDLIGNKITKYDPSKLSNCGATSGSYGIFGNVDTDDEQQVARPVVTESLSSIIKKKNSSIPNRVANGLRKLFRKKE